MASAALTEAPGAGTRARTGAPAARTPGTVRLLSAPGVDVRPLLSFGFAIALLITAAGFLTSNPALRQVGIFGVLFLGVGPAPLQLVPGAGLWTRLGFGALCALTVLTGAGAVMAYISDAWHPFIVAAEVLAIAGLLHLTALVQQVRDGTLEVLLRRIARTSHAVTITPSRLLTLLGTVTWLSATLLQGHLHAINGGILVQMSPAWFGGLLLLIAAIAVADRKGEWELALAIFSLATAIALTPAVVYAAPRSTSAAKHAELVMIILRHHHIDRTYGIYPAYAGFFAGIAWLCALARIANPIWGIATYWPLVVGLIAVVEYRWLFGRVSSSPVLVWLGTLLAILVNSVGQDYFSPQSVGYVMALGVFAIAYTPLTAAATARRIEWALLVPAGLAMAPEHELSPFIVGATLLVGLIIGGEAHPRWGFLAFLAPAGAWALFNHSALKGNLTFSGLFNFSNFAPPTPTGTAGLAPLWNERFSADGLVLSMLILAALAGFAFLFSWRERWSWNYGISASIGLAVILINSYGNEGIFRAALFAIPVLTMLAIRGAPATMLGLGSASHPAWLRRLGRRLRRALTRPLTVGALSSALLAIFLVSQFGMDPSSVIRRSDYAAIQLFEHTTPRNAQLLTVSPGNAPADIPYERDGRQVIAWEEISPNAWVKPGHPTPADLLQMQRRLFAQAKGIPPTHFYALWSPALVAFARAYGLESVQQSDRWLSLLRASPDWQVMFARDQTFLFHFLALGPATLTLDNLLSTPSTAALVQLLLTLGHGGTLLPSALSTRPPGSGAAAPGATPPS